MWLLPDSAPSYAPSVVQAHLPWSCFTVSLLTRLLLFPKSAMNPTLSSPCSVATPALRTRMESKEADGLFSICHKKPDEKTREKEKWRNVRQMLFPAGKDTLGKWALILMVWRQVLPPAIKSSPSSECHISWSWSLLKLRPCVSSFLYKYFN